MKTKELLLTLALILVSSAVAFSFASSGFKQTQTGGSSKSSRSWTPQQIYWGTQNLDQPQAKNLKSAATYTE